MATTRSLCLRMSIRRLLPSSSKCSSSILQTKPCLTTTTNTRSLATNQESLILKSPLRDIEIPKDPFLPHYVFENWNKFGNKTALIDSATNREYTYDQLKDQIAKVGSALVKQGYKKGDVMTIFLPNCVEFAVIYLGAMSIGMTISAVNPLYTADELQFSMSLADTKLLVVSSPTADVARKTLQSLPIKNVMCINGSEGFQPYSNLLNDDGKSFPHHIDCDPMSDVAALLYSSGTTGFPKGVMLTNYNLTTNLCQFTTVETLGYKADDTYLCSLPLFHAFGQICILLAALRVGAKVVISQKFDPVEYLGHIVKYRPNYLHTAPPMLVLFAKHPLVAKCDFSSVNDVFFAAAPAAPSIVQEAKEKMRTNALFRQGYGMTEASPGISTSPSHKVRPETVGVPVHNTDIKIRDITNDSLLGPNKEGEICVRGPQIMKGYLKNEEATRQTIVDGWLHSGDIGFYDEEGYISVTDRLKELIKYKGHQVAPAELEALLLRHPAVADAAVIGKPDEMAGELPLAYVVLKADRNATEDDIQTFVEEYAAPQKYLRGGVEFRSEIPKSASGKILRKILKEELNS